jgi:hypothetical protein
MRPALERAREADLVDVAAFDALGEMARMAGDYAAALEDAAVRSDRARVRLFACQLSRVTRTALVTIGERFGERERGAA